MDRRTALATRDPALQTFLTSLSEAFRTCSLGPEAQGAVERIEDALQDPGPANPGPPQRLPVCTHLDAALATARLGSGAMAAVAEAFAILEPSLRWGRRAAGGPFASENWLEGHANVTIVGPSGFEDRRDLHIGASLLAPHVRYPDHNHGPEEVYLVLSPGQFQHGDSDWFEPGLGGTLYNTPNIRHAMASKDVPLFAVWCLWAGEAP